MIEGMAQRTILHVDLDAFFAAVEQRDRPELRGRPVIVGGEPGSRGVVSAASYEARKFGVHSAMSLREASRRCPNGVFLPVDGRRYQQASRDVMAILRRYTPLVEPISIDEAFLDVTGSAGLFGDGPTIAARIKAAVQADVGLTASVGVASNKLVAKVASDLRKPDGLVVVPAGEEAAFLAPLPIGRLWGVGEKTAVALADYGVRTIGDLAALSGTVMEGRFGKHGASLAERARGIDTDPVHDGRPGQVRRPRAHVRSRTRPTRRSSNGRCSPWPTGWAGGSGRPAFGRARSRSACATTRSARSVASGRSTSRPT